MALALLFALLSGCSGASSVRWGAGATLTPDGQRLKTAATDAFFSPWTWGLALGAAACGVGRLDAELSDWAREETPLFGSTARARSVSDALGQATELAYVTTGLLTPSGATPGEWSLNKAKGFAVGYAAYAGTEGVTNALKEATERRRPDASNRLSFPSGHASRAALFATLAERNLDYLPLTPVAAASDRAALGTLVAGTAWARVEAGKHYPSDVLAGAALGHFLGAFVNDAFLGLDALPRVELSRNELFVGLIWRR